jgi:hypothetical protein
VLRRIALDHSSTRSEFTDSESKDSEVHAIEPTFNQPRVVLADRDVGASGVGQLLDTFRASAEGSRVPTAVESATSLQSISSQPCTVGPSDGDTGSLDIDACTSTVGGREFLTPFRPIVRMVSGDGVRPVVSCGDPWLVDCESSPEPTLIGDRIARFGLPPGMTHEDVASFVQSHRDWTWEESFTYLRSVVASHASHRQLRHMLHAVRGAYGMLRFIPPATPVMDFSVDPQDYLILE